MAKYEKFKVLGYVRPAEIFYTLAQWEEAVLELIGLQNKGIDTRGGEISCKNASFCSDADFARFVKILAEHWGYQLSIEVDRYNLLTKKNVLDFIEDFVNHRFWSFTNEYQHFFPDISRLRFAYFYSRGDLEPYIMLDDEYTTQLYGSLENYAELHHFTSVKGLERLQSAIVAGEQFDISTFTVAERAFFRETSNLDVTLVGNVRAAFRSDIKSLALDNGRRACNMYRLEYPGRDINNICYDISACGGDVATGLWNEYIATPMEILSVREIE